MSDRSVKSAIQKALVTPSSRKKAEVTRDEARAILKAVTTEPKGPAKIGKGEAQLLARLAGQSSFEGGPSPYKVTDAAQKELEAFFAKNNLPIGKNAEAMRVKIEALCAGLELRPLASAPKTAGLHKLLVADGRPYDGALREAYVDPGEGTFFLKTVAGGRGNPTGTAQWFGPISLAASKAPATGTRDADLAALQAKVAAATKDLLYTSESDYPFDFYLAAGAGKAVPPEAGFLKILGQPAGTTVEKRSAAEFFDQRTTPEEWWGDDEKQQAAQYTALRQALESGLTDLTLFRVGDIQVGLYLVGRNAHGDLVGVHTTSIET